MTFTIVLLLYYHYYYFSYRFLLIIYHLNIHLYFSFLTATFIYFFYYISFIIFFSSSYFLSSHFIQQLSFFFYRYSFFILFSLFIHFVYQVFLVQEFSCFYFPFTNFLLSSFSNSILYIFLRNIRVSFVFSPLPFLSFFKCTSRIFITDLHYLSYLYSFYLATLINIIFYTYCFGFKGFVLFTYFCDFPFPSSEKTLVDYKDFCLVNVILLHLLSISLPFLFQYFSIQSLSRLSFLHRAD